MDLPFDRIDRKLLAQLDHDSRQPLSQIARSVRLGSDLVEYRVDRYLAEGYIGKFSAVVDPLAAGWWVVKHYLNLQTTSQKTERLLAFLESHPRTYWLAELYGQFDLLFSTCIRNPSEAEEFQEELQTKFGDVIRGQQICLLSSVARISRKYLTGAAPRVYSIRPSVDRPEISTDDAKLLNALYRNARSTVHELAELLDLSPATVKRKIASLEKKGVLLGYRFQLNYERLGLGLFKLLIRPGSQTKKLHDTLHAYALQHPNVVSFIRQLGPFPFEIEVEVDGYNSMNSFMEEFRESFDAQIDSAEVVLVKRDRFHRFPEEVP